MCHHGDSIGAEWLRELETESADETDEVEESPSFANQDSYVEVDLLKADDD